MAERRRRFTSVSSPVQAQEDGSWGRHRPLVQRPPRVRTKKGCLTCRLRSKRCSNQIEGEEYPSSPCGSCEHLQIECLGYGPKYPDWYKLCKERLITVIRDFTRRSKEADEFLSFEEYYRDSGWTPVFGARHLTSPSDDVGEADNFSNEGGTTSEDISGASPVPPQISSTSSTMRSECLTSSASENEEPRNIPFSPLPPQIGHGGQASWMAFPQPTNVHSISPPTTYSPYRPNSGWGTAAAAHSTALVPGYDPLIGEGPWPTGPSVAAYLVSGV